MEKPIVVIGAMEVEVTTLAQRMDIVEEQRIHRNNLQILTGKLGGREVVLARCGVGKVNAALITQYLIDHFQPQAVINSGVAGGLSPKVLIGDIVIGETSLQHDVDVCHFDYPRGVIPNMEESTFPGDEELTALAVRAAVEELGDGRVHKGLIVSGDQFISSLEHKQQILGFFPDALCAEMEGAAIAQTAHLNGIPHLIVRAISDQADNTAPVDFNAYLMEVIPVLNAVIEKLIRSVPRPAKR